MARTFAALAILLAASAAAGQDAPPPSNPQDTPTPPASGGNLPGGPPKTNPPTVPPNAFEPPTEEDWAKPCLITWQRTWEDALEVSRETRKAILICVSMDGEPASEHYAGKRYRDPAIAKLYEPYVCVIASVYRHA